MKKISPRSWQTAVILIVVAGLLFLSLGGFLTPILNSTFSPFIALTSWFSSRYTAIAEFITVPRDIATLRQINAGLMDENSQLQTQIIQLQQQLSEAQVLYALLDFARAKPENEYVACAVIGRDPSPFLNYIIIDHGSDSGLRHGMPVVTEQGLVGRIDAVTAGAARVQLITDPGSAVNVRLKSAQTEVLLTGSLTGDISLEMIPQDTSIVIGDLVLTSGLGGNYPSDILIGQLVSYRKRENDLFQTASVQPAVDFAQLRAVLVITNFKPVDIAPLIPTPVE